VALFLQVAHPFHLPPVRGVLDDSESIRTIHRALDLGATHIDTAEIDDPSHSEELVGKASSTAAPTT
jgi:aryl-alcohol dehydrogenase-like predicted oxidoreductase